MLPKGNAVKLKKGKKGYHSGNVMKSGLHMLKKGSVVHAPGSSAPKPVAGQKPAQPDTKPIMFTKGLKGSAFYGE